MKKILINKKIIDAYKNIYKGLRHIRTGNDYEGYLYFDCDNLVDFTNMRKSDKYIQAIEVVDDYKGKGYGKKMLNDLIKNGAERLSVNKKNTIAIKMYSTLFDIEKEDNKMLYMIKKGIKIESTMERELDNFLRNIKF